MDRFFSSNLDSVWFDLVVYQVSTFYYVWTWSKSLLWWVGGGWWWWMKATLVFIFVPNLKTKTLAQADKVPRFHFSLIPYYTLQCIHLFEKSNKKTSTRILENCFSPFCHCRVVKWTTQGELLAHRSNKQRNIPRSFKLSLWPY